MKALIIVDMLNDFYSGVLQNEMHASKIVPVIAKLIDHARNNPEWMVVYSNDTLRDVSPQSTPRGQIGRASCRERVL